MSKLVIPPLLATDSYKVSHKGFMVAGTTKIYSNLTPRSLNSKILKQEDFVNIRNRLWNTAQA